MQLLSQVDAMGQKIHRLETVNEQLAHEIAILKRHKLAKRSEQLSPDQGSLLDDLLDTDIAAIEAELKAANPQAAPAEPRQAKLPTCSLFAGSNREADRWEYPSSGKIAIDLCFSNRKSCSLI